MSEKNYCESCLQDELFGDKNNQRTEYEDLQGRSDLMKQMFFSFFLYQPSANISGCR